MYSRTSGVARGVATGRGPPPRSRSQLSKKALSLIVLIYDVLNMFTIELKSKSELHSK